MDKNIRLSELIRIGSRQSQQCFGHLCVVDSREGRPLETCAIGAALLARSGEVREDLRTSEALALCGVDPATPVLAPDGLSPGAGVDFLDRVIIYLNDRMHWSREQIADWLEEIGM